MLRTLFDGLLAAGDFLERHNGAISAISTIFVAFFTYTLWRATTRLWRSSQRQARNLESSIIDAGRSATAMEQVSEALAQTAASAAENTQLIREISERQARIAALQSRAYLSVQFGTVIPQDNNTGYRFEPRMLIINNGHTPAYRVRHRIASNVLPFPSLPTDFEFPLSQGQHRYTWPRTAIYYPGCCPAPIQRCGNRSNPERHRSPNLRMGYRSVRGRVRDQTFHELLSKYHLVDGRQPDEFQHSSAQRRQLILNNGVKTQST